ncbi:LapA family protein [Candidatus Igneacidithiobacillus taiwanensis]|uniref:LapA family protein n=1 Tax=Candidatus Igneacidithiobacillus taiwanensis TaxID=1945924 RepID=UPI0028A095D2|nr:LapA family protein [Candidatus Igneacidithiobacillus taiwanensis]MCE5360691.1 LapA family protein [Acidithiobacillus sp.]
MWIIFSLIIAALAVIFAVQNNTLSAVHFFTWEFQQSAGIIVLIAFVAGAFASAILYLPTHLRNRWRIRKHGKQIGELETKLANEIGRRKALEEEIARQAPQAEESAGSGTSA